MVSLFWVGLGGALGAIGRFSLGSVVIKWLGKGYPYGTLGVNLIGSFAMGMAYVWLVQNNTLGGVSDTHRQLIMVGFLGAFTTFSTFSLESIALLQQGRTVAFFTYIALSLIGCLLATALGMILTKQLV